MCKSIVRRFIFQHLWLYAIPVVLLAVPLYSIRSRNSPEALLAYHRNLWRSKQVSHYSYHLRTRYHYHIADYEVRNGRQVSRDIKGGNDYKGDYNVTMEQYFDSIEKDIADLRQGQLYQLRVKYDATYGYPSHVEQHYPCLAPDCMPIAGESSLEKGFSISNFKRLP